MKYLLYLSICVSLVFTAPVDDDFASASRLFTADVYKQLLVDSKENILVSPFSAETVYALTQSGAKGATAEEIRTTLHLPNTEEATEETFRTVLPSIHSEFVSLVTANKIYVENSYPIKEEFKKIANDVYQADFENIEFAKNEKAAETINKWVEENTGDKIHDLLNSDDISADTKVVLVNALYFQADWAVPFFPKFTKNAKFFTSAETSVDTVTMFQESAEWNYYESSELDAQIVEIPFQGGEASMTVVVPTKKEGIAVLEKQMKTVLTTPAYTKEYVQLSLPKFKIESTIDFKKLMEDLGVHAAFDGFEADFSGMTDDTGLFIGQSKQKTYIEINERGVIAAAATENGDDRSGSPDPTKFVVADHPFVFYIKFHDIILFEGRVLVPES